MSEVKRTLIPAHEAAQMIGNELRNSGIYFLGNNRIGRHDFLIPYYKHKGRVFYDKTDIEYFLAWRTKGKSFVTKGASRSFSKLVEVSEEAWIVDSDITTDHEPVVCITRLTGLEVLAEDDLYEFVEALFDAMDDAKKLAA